MTEIIPEPPACFNSAFNDTDAALDDLRGLTILLSDFATESGMIDHGNHDTTPLMALIRVIERKAHEVAGLHTAQHKAWKAEREAAA